MANVFGIIDDILIVGYDVNDIDHNTALCKVLQICRKESLNLARTNVISDAPVSFLLEKVFLNMGHDLIHKTYAHLQKCQCQSKRRNYNHLGHNELSEATIHQQHQKDVTPYAS